MYQKCDVDLVCLTIPNHTYMTSHIDFHGDNSNDDHGLVNFELINFQFGVVPLAQHDY
jgi:hypothetical protein